MTHRKNWPTQPLKYRTEETMDLFLTGVGIATVIAATKIPFHSTANHVEECLGAYYADKYNGRRDGHPSATFMACLEAHNKDVFKKVKDMYKPSNVE